MSSGIYGSRAEILLRDCTFDICTCSLLHTNFFYDLPGIANKLIGLRSLTSKEFGFFGNGTMVATFQLVGKQQFALGH